MEVTKKEIKKTSRKFRTLASRVMHSHYQEINLEIKMFVDYIEDTPLIINYIKSKHQDIPNLEEDLKNIERSYGRKILHTGETPDDELTYIYQVLKYISENPNYQTSIIGWGYTTSKNYQDMINEFGNRVIQPFAENINNYIMDISTDMGFDEESKFMVTIKGGTSQVNISNDSSTLNAQQYNQINLDELDKIISDLREKLKDTDIETDTKEAILANLNIVEAESKDPEPNKTALNTAMSTLLSFVKVIPQLSLAIEGIKKIYEITAPLLN